MAPLLPLAFLEAVDPWIFIRRSIWLEEDEVRSVKSPGEDR